jgi:hypothetical protein
VSKTDSDMHVDSGVDTTHAVKGVGCVRVHLESGGSLKVAEVSHVPEMKLNILSVSYLEDMRYEIMFEDGKVLICSEGEDTQDATMRLGIMEGMLCKLLGQNVVGSSGFMDSNSVSKGERVEWERELISGTQSSSRTLIGINRNESTQMDAQESVKSPRSISSVHRSMEVAEDASSAMGVVASCSVGVEAYSTEGATTTTDELETDFGGGTISTSH